MKIIIPLNGKGARFSEKGYTDSKPFININGTSILCNVVKSLNIDKEELIILARKEYTKNNLDFYLYKNFPKIKSKVVYLEKDTIGPADTLLTGLKSLYNGTLVDEPFLAIDSDTIYNDEIISKLKDINSPCIFYSETTEEAPLYSYIKIDENNNVVDIAEKIKISNLANTGAYFFNSSKRFFEIAESLLEVNKDNREIYTSLVYKKMIDDGAPVKSIFVNSFNAVGTPLQLQNYSMNNKSKPKRFVFDLDNTLVTHPRVSGDYSTVEPITENINFLKHLKDAGNYIIIYTARRMKTHSGNVAKVVADIGDITIQTLKKYDIQYDELQFGKPYADFYIDDLSINPLKEDLQQCTGFYYPKKVESRPFNTVEIIGDIVTKRGNISGEIYWYKNCPYYIIDKYFPKIYSLSDSFIQMERVEGASFSHLYTSGLVTETILSKILTALDDIHKFNEPRKGVYINNYKEKILKRFEENKQLYASLNGSNAVLSDLIEAFDNYKIEDGSIIHGDPVFSNIFLTTSNDIKFIDVRGSNGCELTIYGDPLYDYAKIYQSILGYDFILLGKEIDLQIVEEMRRIFIDLITKKNIDIDIVSHITKSHIFSLLPLHTDEVKIKKYFDLIKTI
jgi:capsule biosynthesis phosphatase